MALIGIVAVDSKNAIGKGGALPWHYSSDLKFFKGQTTGHVCVMGRRTWATLKRPLPNRLNVVLSRGLDSGGADWPAGAFVVRDTASLLALVPYLARDVYVIGGAQIYGALRAEIDEWIVTRVPVTVEGADTYMPADFLDGFAPRDTRQLEEDLHVTFYARAK